MERVKDKGRISDLIQLMKNADEQKINLENNITSIKEELNFLNTIFKTSSPSTSSNSYFTDRIEQLSIVNKIHNKAQEDLTRLRKEVSLNQIKCNVYHNQINKKSKSLNTNVNTFLNYAKSIRDKYELRSTELLKVYSDNKTKFPLSQHHSYYEQILTKNLKRIRQQQEDLKEAKIKTHILKLQEEIRYETQLMNMLQGRKKELIDLISRSSSI